MAGWYGAESLLYLTPLILGNSANSSYTNCFALSETRATGTPYAANKSSGILIVAKLVEEFVIFTYTHLMMMIRSIV